MNLKPYYNKNVIVIDTNDVEHKGCVDSYTPSNDNGGQDAISLTSGIWLDESDIKSIKIV